MSCVSQLSIERIYDDNDDDDDDDAVDMAKTGDGRPVGRNVPATVGRRADRARRRSHQADDHHLHPPTRTPEIPPRAVSLVHPPTRTPEIPPRADSRVHPPTRTPEIPPRADSQVRPSRVKPCSQQTKRTELNAYGGFRGAVSMGILWGFPHVFLWVWCRYGE